MAKGVDQVILSTSVHADDAVLADLAAAEGFAAFRGSEDDKLDRYYQTALHYGLDAVVIVDGDDPFCFPEGIDLVAAALREGRHWSDAMTDKQYSNIWLVKSDGSGHRPLTSGKFTTHRGPLTDSTTPLICGVTPLHPSRGSFGTRTVTSSS